MTTTTHPTPPAAGLASIEAEQSVLGGLLIDATPWPDVAAMIDPSAFSHRPYGHVFSAISALIAEHSEVDAVTVFDRLRHDGHAEAVGGLLHLNELAASVPSASGSVRYARIVADRARRRALLALTDEAAGHVGSADSADAAIDDLAAKLGQLQRVNARGAPRRLGEFVRRRADEVQAVADGRASPGMMTGLERLDKALGGLKRGKVYVIAARPSVGKTALALQILLALGRAGEPGLMLSQEMTGTELGGRALAHSGDIHMGRLDSGQLEDADWAAMAEQMDALDGLPVWIDDQPALRLVEIAAKAREVKRTAGLSLVVIDYLQLCATEARGPAQSRHHQLEALSRGLKTLAKELNVAVLLLSQLNRNAEAEEPELMHLKESGAIEEDADAVLLLHAAGNDPDGGLIVCCKVAKNRGGRRGRLALLFRGATQRWESSNADVSRKGRRSGADE